jgi:hypothetical protein
MNSTDIDKELQRFAEEPRTNEAATINPTRKRGLRRLAPFCKTRLDFILRFRYPVDISKRSYLISSGLLSIIGCTDGTLRPPYYWRLLGCTLPSQTQQPRLSNITLGGSFDD